MRREELSIGARTQLAVAIQQLHAAGISVTEESILEHAIEPIIVGPREPTLEKLRELGAEWTASPAPRNRHERRKAAALSRRS